MSSTARAAGPTHCGWALTGQLDLNGLTDPAVMQALDLCLECKACKSEVPQPNVDMARLSRGGTCTSIIKNMDFPGVAGCSATWQR